MLTNTAESLPPGLAPLADERFVSLTTFRRSGEPVATPVWIGSDGHSLLITTPAQSGKVKRLRHTSRVELRPCSRSGRVEPGTTPVRAEATIVDSDAHGALVGPIRHKYGIEYRLVMGAERLMRGRGSTRVILRVTESIGRLLQPDPGA